MRIWRRPQLLGVTGIVGGLALLAAFVTPISPNAARLVAFNVGAIAVATGMAMTHPSTKGARFIAPVVFANALYAAMVVLALGMDEPSTGVFGLTFFVVGIALWLTDAAFGAWVVSSGPRARVSRVGGFVLALGSLMALAGLDRLGLAVHESSETVFTYLPRFGVFMNSCGWCVLGLALLRSGSRDNAGLRGSDDRSARVNWEFK